MTNYFTLFVKFCKRLICYYGNNFKQIMLLYLWPQLFTVLSVQGIEDYMGDMDFKMAGTREGFTSLQVIYSRGDQDIQGEGLLNDN